LERGLPRPLAKKEEKGEGKIPMRVDIHFEIVV
jgi:hypothetical protein